MVASATWQSFSELPIFFQNSFHDLYSEWSNSSSNTWETRKIYLSYCPGLTYYNYGLARWRTQTWMFIIPLQFYNWNHFKLMFHFYTPWMRQKIFCCDQKALKWNIDLKFVNNNFWFNFFCINMRKVRLPSLL